MNTAILSPPHLQAGFMLRPDHRHDTRQQKKAEDVMGNLPGGQLESGTPALAGRLASTVDMVDQSLSLIGARMEQHLAQLAKELTVISRLASDGRQQLLQMENNENFTCTDVPGAVCQNCTVKARQNMSMQANRDIRSL